VDIVVDINMIILISSSRVCH